MKNATYEDLGWGICLIIAINSTAIIFNVFIVCMILRKQELRQKVSNVCLILLLMGHTVMNLESLSYYALYYVYKIYHLNPSAFIGKLHICMLIGSISAQCFSTIVITLDRFFSITRPFVYQRLGNKIPLIGGISMFAIGVVAFLVRFFTDSSKSSIIISSFNSLTQFVMCFCNYQIYRIIKQQFISIRATAVTADEAAAKKMRQELLKREMKATKICAWVVTTYVLFTLPTGIDQLFSSRISNYHTYVPREVSLCLIALALCNSIVDPLIYLHSNRQMKQELRNFFTKTRFNTQNRSEITQMPATSRMDN